MCEKTRNREMQEIAKSLNYNILYIPEYISKEKMKIKCDKGHTFEITWANFKKGRKCSHCYKYKKLTHEEVALFIAKLGYELISQYYTANKKIEVLCSKGHNFITTYGKLQSGRRCPYCSGKFIHVNDVRQELTKDEYTLHSNFTTTSSKIWIKCNEDHMFETTYTHYKAGRRCPICNQSKGEKKVEKVLTSLNLEFVQQKKFEECRNTLCLPFDFYIPLYNLCIEYDGEQHFTPVDFAGKGEDWARENHEKVKQNDKIKSDFCEKEGIELLRVPYWDKDKIENIIIDKLHSLGGNFND